MPPLQRFPRRKPLQRQYLVGLVVNGLKTVYKASQEKKERTHPRGAEWFCFYLTAPSSVF